MTVTTVTNLFARLETDDDGVAVLRLLGDPDLSARIEEMAGRFEETPGEYVSGGIRRFARLAGDQDWLSLTTALEKSDDPEMTTVRRMLLWSLLRDTAEIKAEGGRCGCGSGHGAAP
jgi:hypothetical protein